MFQSVMNDEERHDIGAHYTSEENILKLIRPLFLDGLRYEFEKIKKLSPTLRRERLLRFHDKLASLTFLDPACGCGNFLVISYRELRLLELEILGILLGKDQVLDVHGEIKVNVNQFYGIEIEEFPAQIAQVALWLIDHQMNLLVRERFGTYYIRIPLTAAASIHHANALALDWESVIPKDELDYILGNPPFLGARVMSKEQKVEVNTVFNGMKDNSNLDYVTCWYKKAAQYIQETDIEAAFVSTNSICQGEQVPVLWPGLMNRHNIKINFAHQTFKGSNEARGNAAGY
jgi:type II restriction/modification system DNA methylase subunit YeeA